MAKQQTEEELNLKRKTRRRLIGAIALMLVVVVVLPMVLDNEPKTTGNDIQLSIPDPDNAGTFIPKVAAPEHPATSTPAADAAAAANGATTPPPAAAKPAVIQPQPEKPAAVKKQAAVAKPSTDKGGERYVAQTGAYANADTAKQELKKLKQWGFKAYTEKVGANVRVRVGPYQERSKAEKVGHLLEKHGLHPVIVSDK